MKTFAGQELKKLLLDDIKTYQARADSYQLRGEFGNMERYTGRVDEARRVLKWLEMYEQAHEI